MHPRHARYKRDKHHMNPETPEAEPAAGGMHAVGGCNM